MSKKISCSIICCLALLSFGNFSNAAEALKIDTELAVSIDVSGSMKQNDPQNLRIPALKLLISLLPDHANAGIWLFDQSSTPLTKFGPVNKSWKQRALHSLTKIHSDGLFTNIEGALKSASEQWPASGSQEIKRSILLLTDGVVDVAKDAKINQDSKQRILSELLPKLQQLGVHIQTIALSKNADDQLLKQLATTTNGWHETVESAEQLERIFFKMFKQSIPQESVPIQKDNKFTIDNSIKEFSALIFKKSAVKTELIAPGNQIINQATNSSKVEWIGEHNFDLLTVKNPSIGTWQIKTDADPDNQVMILTDLNFAADELPQILTKPEPIKFRAHFTDQGKLLQTENFLNMIEIIVRISDGTNELPELRMLPVAGEKGYFEATLANPLAAGRYLFTIVADGKTFTRELNHSLEVLAAPIALTSKIDNEHRQIQITLIPDPKSIDPQSLTLQAQLNQTGHEPKTLEIPKNGEQWQLSLDAPEQNSKLIVNFVALAKSPTGQELHPELQPLTIDAAMFSVIDKVESKPVESGQEAINVETAKKIPEPADIHPELKPEMDWKKTAIIIAAVNGITLTAAFFMYRFINRRTLAKQAQLLDKLS